MKTKKILAFFLLVCLFSFSPVFPAFAEHEVTKDIVEEVLDLMEQNYLYSFDPVACREEVRQALISHSRKREKTNCLDAHFGYFSTEEYKERRYEEEKEHFYGIGVGIMNSPDGVKILEVIKKGPAEKAGIKTGDILLAVRQEGEKDSIKVATIQEAIRYIKGPDGTKVWVSVKRQEKILVIPVTREKVEIKEVSFKKLKNGILYISLEGFSLEKTAKDMHLALKNAETENALVIIDVRDNPGGKLSSVLKMLYDFSKNQDDVMITTKNRGREEIETIDSFIFGGNFFNDFFKTPGAYRHYRVVVLINKYSASAAEIFSGVLQDWGRKTGRFTVLGETSYGKGIGQGVFVLSDESALKFTTFEFLAGNGKTPIHEIGVVPDYPVKDSRKDYTDTATSKDRQFMEAVKILENMK